LAFLALAIVRAGSEDGLGLGLEGLRADLRVSLGVEVGLSDLVLGSKKLFLDWGGLLGVQKGTGTGGGAGYVFSLRAEDGIGIVRDFERGRKAAREGKRLREGRGRPGMGRGVLVVCGAAVRGTEGELRRRKTEV
jgi:hypothetical protein